MYRQILSFRHLPSSDGLKYIGRNEGGGSCEVEKAEMLTSDGWTAASKSSSIFRLFPDGKRTFLQWLGKDSDRRDLEGQLIVIRMTCGDLDGHPPCLAFRAAGTSVTWSKEEEKKAEEVEEEDWEARKIDDYVVIGMCAGILALIYVLAVIVFVTVRKGRWRQTRRRNKSVANGTGRQVFRLECEYPAPPVIPRPFLMQYSAFVFL
ncbi:unnamed protein product [Darwinula stevensoni]|uniref:Uncharacterized protein n=1 Tax=Darwinula stevensoni TaxID=69355 RepID=A0A7R8XKG2_9CRUS|nr:unnamed protein product [Darwinula stevensoni]CAG0895696.1 unnamed protein product [Darwinula stevensoni]